MPSERLLLKQLAPEIEEDTIRRLVAAFQDLRDATLTGKLSYPYSLRGKLSYLTHYYSLFLSPLLLPFLSSRYPSFFYISFHFE